MFFECLITKSYRPKLESTCLGLLSVTGGELTIPAIITQLRRLVPVENFTWECRQVGHNVFKVTFPDRDEIERLARFGTFHVPNSSIKLTFEQYVSSMEPTSKLPKVWILMSGIPERRIGDFLAMWSLGTQFGKTLKVDMKYTREKGVLRILVGCLDFRRIPAKEHIFIGDGFYDISFEVQILNDFEMVSASIPGEDQSLMVTVMETTGITPLNLRKIKMIWTRTQLVTCKTRRDLKIQLRMALMSIGWPESSLPG
jgi:hypothetical protein